MIGITNFNPIQSINSLIQPFGLKVSNKQQIINKVALASLAIISLSHLVPAVVGDSSYRDCVDNRCGGIDRDCCNDVYKRCLAYCRRNYG
ncbi:MAG: hypothetical protein ACRDAI_03530 [Candidatus Rhabdochlamydia sp.]